MMLWNWGPFKFDRMQYAECSSEPSVLHLKNLIVCMPKIISPLPFYVDMNCDLLLLGHCCGQLVGTVVSNLGDPGPKSWHWDWLSWVVLWFQSVHSCKCWFSIWNKAMATFFHILSSSLFTDHTCVWSAQTTDSIITYTVEKLILRRKHWFRVH